MSTNMIFDLIIKNEKEELIGLLKRGNIDLDEKDEYGSTPLQEACEEGNLEIAKILLNHHLNINAQGIDGYTALHYAVQAESADLVDLLAENKADLNFADDEGNTPLWTAVMSYSGDDSVIKALLKHGAAPAIPNKHGVTLFEFLDMPKNREIKHLF